eukprot:1011548_1
MDEDLKANWKELQEDFYPLESTCNSDSAEFKNPDLLEALNQLGNDAKFAPLIAHDIHAFTDFAPPTQTNTWEIEFNTQWQNNDQNNQFNKWCKRIHKLLQYDNIMRKCNNML